jgi:hydrogenase expression/formation protein HypC
MCLAIPARVIEATGTLAKVDILGNSREADLTLVGSAEPGEYVLVHAGFAIQKLSEEDAQATLRLFAELGKNIEDLNEEGLPGLEKTEPARA